MLKHEATLAKPEKHSYTKRMVTGPDGSLFSAQTSGKVLAFAPDGAARTLADFGSAVRDIAVDAAGGAVFVCLESGHAHRLAADTGKVDASWVVARRPSRLGAGRTMPPRACWRWPNDRAASECSTPGR